MNSKILSLLIVFLGLPSFMFTGSSHGPTSAIIEKQSETDIERELRELRTNNNVSVDYLKYKMVKDDYKIAVSDKDIPSE